MAARQSAAFGIQRLPGQAQGLGKGQALGGKGVVQFEGGQAARGDGVALQQRVRGLLGAEHGSFRGTAQGANTRRLVYGWKLIDWVLDAGDARMLFAPQFQTEDEQSITELRVLQGSRSLRYTLPDTSVGAAIRSSTIYAFSADSLYRADINAQRFTALKLPAPIDQPVTGYIGKLTNGVALINCGQDVYALTLP